MTKYTKLTASTSTIAGNPSGGMAGDLDMIAREGARQMLVAVLEAEVTEFLGRQRYERAAVPASLCEAAVESVRDG